MKKERIYAAIDLKSFYASVEAQKRVLRSRRWRINASKKKWNALRDARNCRRLRNKNRIRDRF